MINSQALSFSTGPYKEDAQNLILRGYKYLRVVRQFNHEREIPKEISSRFLKQLKKVKTLKSFKFNIGCVDTVAKAQTTFSIIKTISSHLKELDACVPAFRTNISRKKSLACLKEVHTMRISPRQGNIRGFHASRKLENLLLNMGDLELNLDISFKVLNRLNNIKNFGLIIPPKLLDQGFLLLNKVSAAKNRSIKFQIATKDEEGYVDPTHISPSSILSRFTKVELQSLNTSQTLQSLLSSQSFELSNLRNLKLGFNVPDTELLSCLKYLKQIPMLEKLTLYFVEWWRSEFVEGVLNNLQLPSSLQHLKINMPLLFENLLTVGNINDIIQEKGKYSWRTHNLFEREPLFKQFFQALEEAHSLKKAEFSFHLLEGFKSCYTNFFVSIVNRLPNVSSLAFYVTDQTLHEYLAYTTPDHFDLSMLFGACSGLRYLTDLEVFMPNLLFEDAEISHTMGRLQSFHIGITENEEEGVLKFQNIFKRINRWLKNLLAIAPNLTSLIFDFTEIINEKAFYERFALIQRFKELKAFCSRFKIEECTPETTKTVGKMITSLKTLDTILLKFIDSDDNILEMRKFLRYKRSIKDAFFSFNEKSWVGKDDSCLSDTDSESDETNSLSDSSLNETTEYDTIDVIP